MTPGPKLHALLFSGNPSKIHHTFAAWFDPLNDPPLNPQGFVSEASDVAPLNGPK